MDEMRMQPFAAGRPLGGQHQRLPEPPQAVAGRIMREVRGKGGERPPEAGRRQARRQRAQHAQRLFVQILREIVHSRADFVVDRVALAFGRPPQGDDDEVQARLLQAEQFLCDKGFRQPRIALYDDHDLAPHLLAPRPLAI